MGKPELDQETVHTDPIPGGKDDKIDQSVLLALFLVVYAALIIAMTWEIAEKLHWTDALLKSVGVGIGA